MLLRVGAKLHTSVLISPSQQGSAIHPPANIHDENNDTGILHLQVMCRAVLLTLEMVLEQQWTPETARAWQALFDAATVTMGQVRFPCQGLSHFQSCARLSDALK